MSWRVWGNIHLRVAVRDLAWAYQVVQRADADAPQKSRRIRGAIAR